MRQPGNSTEGIQRHRVSSLGELACSRKLSRLIRGRVCAARSPRLHAQSAQDPAGASFRRRATSAECLQHSSRRQHARLFGSNVVRCLSILLHSNKPSVAIRARGRERTINTQRPHPSRSSFSLHETLGSLGFLNARGNYTSTRGGLFTCFSAHTISIVLVPCETQLLGDSKSHSRHFWVASSYRKYLFGDHSSVLLLMLHRKTPFVLWERSS